MGRMNELDPQEGQLPHSVEAERGVLACLLIDATAAYDKVSAHVSIDDFFMPDHKLIFEAISKLSLAGTMIDPVTVMDAIERTGMASSTGGVGYLRKLVQRTTDTQGMEGWCRIIRENSQRRQVIAACRETIDSMHAGGQQTVSEVASNLEMRLHAIGDQGRWGAKTMASIGEFSMLAVDIIQAASECKAHDGVTGIRTPFPSLDRETSGLQPGDLIILAARPSMGKTSMALQIAEHVAMKEGLPVVVFSMEMGGEQLALRQISSISRIDHKRLRAGDLRDSEWNDLTDAVEQLTKVNEWIDTQGGLNPAEMRARARSIKRKHGQLGLIVIDYLQLMTAIKGDEKQRAAQIAAISSALKAMAKELDVPVLALSQLNRLVELRPDKRPMMSDLRESGSLEQDADVIMFIYRDDYYNADSANKGMSELIIAKQRNGPTGMVLLRFIKEQSRHEDAGRY
jgi:replicative DNA helicase